MIRMHRVGIAVAALGVIPIAGCAAQQPQTHIATAHSVAYEDAEAQFARQAFIDGKTTQLQQAYQELGRLDAKIATDPRYASAGWTQRVSDAEQQRLKVVADLNRVRTAPLSQWGEMKPLVASDLNLLEADGTAVASAMGQPFAIAAAPAPYLRSDELCALNVPHTKASVTTDYDSVDLSVVAVDMPDLTKLRQRADKLADISEYPAPVATGQVPVQVSLETIGDGVVVSFTPKSRDDLAPLAAAVRANASAAQLGMCSAATTSFK